MRSHTPNRNVRPARPRRVAEAPRTRLAGVAVASACAAAALLLAGPAPEARAQVLAQAVPTRLEVTVESSDWVSRRLFIHNLGLEPVRVRLRLGDLTLDEQGGRDLRPPGSLPVSLAGSVRFDPERLALKPGERGMVIVAMRLPAQGPATRYGVILSEVESASRRRSHDPPAELGTELFLTRLGARSVRAELTAVDVRPAADGSLQVGIRLDNRCERYVLVSGDVAIADTSGKPIARSPLPSAVVLPGAQRVFAWSAAPRLAPGRYRLIASLDAGEPELLVGERAFVVPGRRLPAAGDPAPRR